MGIYAMSIVHPGLKISVRIQESILANTWWESTASCYMFRKSTFLWNKFWTWRKFYVGIGRYLDFSLNYTHPYYYFNQTSDKTDLLIFFSMQVSLAKLLANNHIKIRKWQRSILLKISLGLGNCAFSNSVLCKGLSAVHLWLHKDSINGWAFGVHSHKKFKVAKMNIWWQFCY